MQPLCNCPLAGTLLRSLNIFDNIFDVSWLKINRVIPKLVHRALYQASASSALTTWKGVLEGWQFYLECCFTSSGLELPTVTKYLTAAQTPVTPRNSAAAPVDEKEQW